MAGCSSPIGGNFAYGTYEVIWSLFLQASAPASD
jgi:hypothetical protein